jgi:alkylation response protein AidB-like acyl-CoA dehydrogenase
VLTALGGPARTVPAPDADLGAADLGTAGLGTAGLGTAGLGAGALAPLGTAVLDPAAFPVSPAGLDAGDAELLALELPEVGAAFAAATARRDAAAMERDRRLSCDVAAAVSRAGFPRHFVPARWGGRAGSFGELVRASQALSHADASAGWCATLYAAHGRLAAYLPEEGQRDLWAVSPDVRIAASVVPPQGRAEEVPGGWRLSGEWGFASGVDHAGWILLASWTTQGDAREHRIFAVPAQQATVRDTWHTMGLRGTGSNSVVLDGVTVPAARSFTLGSLLRPLPGAARCHAVPFPMVAALMFAAPVVGAARGAVDLWREAMAVRRGMDGSPVCRTAPVQQVLTRTSAAVHAAALLLAGAAERADRGEVTPVSAAECQRDAAMAVDLCVEAAQRLFRATGARGQAEDDLVQRHWRDVTAAAAHATLNFDAAATAYAGAVFAEAPGAA